MVDKEEDRLRRLMVLTTLHGPTTIPEFENEYRTKMRRLMQMRQERKNPFLVDFKLFATRLDYELMKDEFNSKRRKKR